MEIGRLKRLKRKFRKTKLNSMAIKNASKGLLLGTGSASHVTQ